MRLAIYVSICRSIYLSIDRSVSLSSHPSFDFKSVFENATKPSRFSHFSVDAQSTPPTVRNDVWTSKMSPRSSVFNTFDFEMCFAPQGRALFRHLNFQKCSETASFYLTRLTSKCASRHNGVHFFDISTSKSAPRPSVFNTFNFQMCFAPQRRALFHHLNFQKCSEPLSF